MTTDTQTVLITLSDNSFRDLIYDTVKVVIDRRFAEFLIKLNKASDRDDIGGIELAISLTGFRRSTVYKYVQNGEIPYTKIRGKLLFSRKALASWIYNNGNDLQKKLIDSIEK